MSEQARIETAVEATIDNCEVLRARLAKYEDADGNPASTIAEQAREIETLKCAVLVSQRSAVSIATELRAELAALKAKPDPWKASGADWCSSIHSNPDAKAWADFFVAVFPGQADKHELMIGWFANAMMAMNDHLKSQPTFNDEREAFEAWRLEKFCGGVERLKKCSNAPDVYYYTAEQEAWKVWQATRAALCVEFPLPVKRAHHEYDLGYNEALDHCEEAIHAARVKTK